METLSNDFKEKVKIINNNTNTMYNEWAKRMGYPSLEEQIRQIELKEKEDVTENNEKSRQ